MLVCCIHSQVPTVKKAKRDGKLESQVMVNHPTSPVCKSSDASQLLRHLSNTLFLMKDVVTAFLYVFSPQIASFHIHNS